MNSLNKITLVVVILLLSNQEIFTQSVNDLRNISSLSQNEANINDHFGIVSRSKNKNNDFDVSEYLRKEKINLSCGTGVSFSSIWTDAAFHPGINFQLNATKVMSKSHAIRFDFQYAHNVAINKYGNNYEEGDLNTYGLRFNFILANFEKKTPLRAYGILGGGLSSQQQEDTKYSYPEYNYQTGEYTGRTVNYSQNNEASHFINADLGAGLNYQVSKKLKLYGEAQYSFPVVYFYQYPLPLLFYGIPFGSPSIRAGVQFEL